MLSEEVEMLSIYMTEEEAIRLNDELDRLGYDQTNYTTLAKLHQEL